MMFQVGHWFFAKQLIFQFLSDFLSESLFGVYFSVSLPDFGGTLFSVLWVGRDRTGTILEFRGGYFAAISWYGSSFAMVEVASGSMISRPVPIIYAAGSLELLFVMRTRETALVKTKKCKNENRSFFEHKIIGHGSGTTLSVGESRVTSIAHSS